MSNRECSACGAHLLFATLDKSKTGKPMPLEMWAEVPPERRPEKKPPSYRLTSNGHCTRDDETGPWVSHYSACPKASTFTRKR